ncbi:MAG TPA: hypothetical protein VHC19_02840, partial [Pirellulales bacterium]|nr:hypothetical protein [Pirellulales bacterium]
MLDASSLGAPPPATHLELIAPPTAFSGAPTSLQVVALDAANHPVLDYAGTVEFSSSDGNAALPDSYTFTADDHGAHMFKLTLDALGKDTVTATDASAASIDGTVSVAVTPAPEATHLGVVTPDVSFAGAPTTVCVVALDASNHPVANFTGTVSFASSNADDSLPDSYTFTADDHGAHQFQVQFADAGNDTLTVADADHASVSGAATANVIPAPMPTHFQVMATGPAVAGQPTEILAVALDASNHPVPNYAGTVSFASSDNSDALPDNYTFVADDHGAHKFQATLGATGDDTLTVTDADHSVLTGSDTLNVLAASSDASQQPGPATHFHVIVAPSAFAGQQITVTVIALDASNHPAADYTGTVQFTSSDANATLPDSYTFAASDHGKLQFQAVLGMLGRDTLTATDSTTASITDTAALFVTPAPEATHFQVVTQEVSFAGQPAMVSVIALDAANNPVPNFTGTVSFASGNNGDVLPDSYTFVAEDHGVHRFQVTFASPGSDTLTVTNADDSSATGSATTLAIPAPEATHFQVIALAPAVAGQPTPVRVVALDASNNPVPFYAGNIQFASSGDSDLLPDSYTFTEDDYGTHVFQVTFAASGSDTLTVTDGSQNPLSGTETVNVLETQPGGGQPGGGQPGGGQPGGGQPGGGQPGGGQPGGG